MKDNAAAILVTSYAVEIATKTLHAQTKPNEKPPNGHDLLYLFDELPQDAQAKGYAHAQDDAP